MLGIVTKVEALKKAVAEAEKKAITEQALREKHEARVIEAEQELQEAVKKCETLEQSLTEKEYKLTRANQAARDARGVGLRSNFKKIPTHTQDHGDA